MVYQEETPGKEGFQMPRITNVTSEVVAGIRRAVSLSGFISTQKRGIVSIEGSGFNSYTLSELASKMPNEVRVQMRREDTNPSDGKTISPVAGDFISWSDNLIEFYAPTTGYLDQPNSANRISRNGAFSGRIRVITEGGADRAPSNTNVFFNQRSNLTADFSRPFGPSTDDISIRKQRRIDGLEIESSERGLTFVIDPTFVTSLRFSAGDLAAAKLDLCDAAAEWTSATGIPIDIVDNCPIDIRCSIITGAPISVSSTNTNALAAGFSSAVDEPCDVEEQRAFDAELRFNNSFSPPLFISRATSGIGGGRDVVYDQALHEFGHILQQNHVDNPNELMFPLAGSNNSVTAAAVECGIHVRNVAGSLVDHCDNVLLKDFTPTSCGTSSSREVLTKIDGINIWYDAISNNLTISIELDITSELPLTVFDAVGRPIFDASCSYGDNIYSMDQYPTGFYSIFIKGSQTQLAKSFVKQ